MSEYFATVSWNRKADESFIDNKYSRGHNWQFDGGVVVPASSSPHIVPLPYSVEATLILKRHLSHRYQVVICCFFFRLPRKENILLIPTLTMQ